MRSLINRMMCVMWCVLCIAVLPTPLCGEEKQEAGSFRRLLPYKTYARLTPVQVARFAGEDRNVDLLFDGRYEGPERAPDREVRFGDRTYRIARALRFENDIVGFIPAGHADSIITAENLQAGQMVSVFGFIIGRRRADNFVLVERLLTGDEEQPLPLPGYELRLRGPGGSAMTIDKEGSYSFEFPCRYERDETEKVTVAVTAVSAEEFGQRMAEMARDDDAEEVEVEDRPDETMPRRRYTRYDALTVYRAIGEERRLVAGFTDGFRRREGRFPSEVRDPDGRRVRIGGAFLTATGIFCLAPERSEELISRLDLLLPDMPVSVRGVTMSIMGGERLFLVDELSLPGLVEPPEPDFVWIVSVVSGEDRPSMFYREGRYRLQFPCSFDDRREEVMEAELSKVLVVEMETDGS